MNKNKSKLTIDCLFNSDNELLKDLTEKVYLLTALNEIFQEIIDPSLRGHCKVANVNNGQIIIEVASPAWGTQLRYRFPEILHQLRQRRGFEGLSGIDYYIKPQEVETKPKVKPTNNMRITKDSSEALKACAEDIEHPGLKNILEKLASHCGDG